MMHGISEWKIIRTRTWWSWNSNVLNGHSSSEDVCLFNNFNLNTYSTLLFTLCGVFVLKNFPPACNFHGKKKNLPARDFYILIWIVTNKIELTRPWAFFADWTTVAPLFSYQRRDGLVQSLLMQRSRSNGDNMFFLTIMGEVPY